MLYNGYTLYHCWCGYPEKRWMIYADGKWIHTSKTLKEAKIFINEKDS